MKPALFINYIPRAKCGICGAKSFSQMARVKDFDTDLGDFDLIRCNNCAAVWTSPYPDAGTLPNLYINRDSNNFQHKDGVLLSFLKNLSAKLFIKKSLKNFAKNGVVFADVGAGDGRFACMFRELYPESDVTAVDFAPAAPKSLSQSITYLQTRDFFESGKRYDIILLRHVLEHVEHPVDFIKKLADKLNPGGILLVEAPNIENVFCRYFTKFSPSFYPPYHLAHFTRKSFAAVFEKAGLKADISQGEMPLVSNLLANMTGIKLNIFFQLMGIVLYPAQVILGFFSGEKTVLIAAARKN